MLEGSKGEQGNKGRGGGSSGPQSQLFLPYFDHPWGRAPHSVEQRWYLDDPILGDTWGQCGLNCFLLLSFYLFCQHWAPCSLGWGSKL